MAAMTDDQWQAHVTREAAREIGRWLEGRGRLHQPITTLSLAELEGMATAAISRFVLLASERIARAAAGERGPDRAAAAPRPCALCSRQDRGFGYTHELRSDRYPGYRFCSMHCLDAGSALARRNNGMIDKTDMERKAIKDARRPFAEALTELGLMEPLQDRSAAEIDRLIEACIDGFRDSMQRQSLNDDVPF